MATDPNSPNIQDIINAAGQAPLDSRAMPAGPEAQPPTPPTLLNAATPAPTLGTEGQLQAPAAAASPNNLSAASSAAPGAAPSSITLPAQTKDNSAIPSGEQSQNQPSMLRKIGMFAADLGGAPQLAQPGSTIAQKAQGIMSILGKIGAAGTAAVGSPQQKEQAIQRQAQQNQLLQMQNEAAYRQGMLGNTQERNATYAEKVASDAARKEQQSDLDHLKMNMVKDPITGTYRTATPDETLNNQFMDHNQQTWHDANALKQAQTNLDQAKRDAIMNPDNIQNQMKVKHYEAQINMAQQRYDLSNAQFQRGTQQFAKEDDERRAKMVEESYGRNTALIEKQRQPIDAQVQRLGRLNDTINQGNPQADSLIAPELLSVMAGGQGSGLRMNEAEISRIVGGRNQWQSLKAKLMAYQADPTKPFSFTDIQRQETRALLGVVTQKLNQKEDLLNGAQQTVATSQDPLEHRQAVSNLQQQLTAIDNPPQEAAQPQVKQTATKPVAPGSDEHQRMLQSITLPNGGHPADYATGPNGAIVKLKPGDPWTSLATGQPVK